MGPEIRENQPFRRSFAETDWKGDGNTLKVFVNIMENWKSIQSFHLILQLLETI